MRPSLYLIAGLGKTGHSIARYLRRRNKQFVVFDTRLEPEGLLQFKEEFPGVEVHLGEIPEALYPHLIEIISSPGVALDNPCIQKAVSQGILVLGDIECLAREVRVPVIAITGTNGKSTVTSLVGAMAKASGLKVAVAGNIGSPVLDALDDGKKYDLWVLELSSFQLDLTHSLAPLAATILNITEDHIDRHHTFEAYVKAKQRIYHHAKTIVFNRDDPFTALSDKAMESNLSMTSFGLDLPKEGQWGLLQDGGVDYLAYGTKRWLAVNDIRLKGRHNYQNALAACALSHVFGISSHHMVNVLKQFTGLPHRTQWVRTIDGVDWINDSKGTNVGATISAITGVGSYIQGKIVLIAGGQGKGADFKELRSSITNYVRSVVLIGEDAEKLERALSDVVTVMRAPSFDKAITMAKGAAKPKDVVLLSPACASFDMFKDFNHRGESFTIAVNAL